MGLFDSYLSGMNSGYKAVSNGLHSIGGWFDGSSASYFNERSSLALMDAQSALNRENYAWQLEEGPSMQVKGLEKAGINPILAYASGGSPSAGSVAPVSAPVSNGGKSGSIADIMSLFSWVTAACKVFSDIQNTQADTKLKNSQIAVNSTVPLLNSAKAQREVAEAREPGWLGQTSRTVKSWFSDAREADINNHLTVGDFVNWVKSFGSVTDETGTKSSSKNSSKSVEPAVEAARQVMKMTPRMAHELNQHKPATTKKRKHN